MRLHHTWPRSRVLYLVLSDIHANLEALDAVLADAASFDATLCLGDVIGYGPNPNECVDRVRALPQLTCLVGNHDWAALGKVDVALFNPLARYAAEWTSGQLRPGVRRYLEELQPMLQTDSFALAHASPRDPIWEYLEVAEQAPPNFREFQAPFCFVGHTHVPRTFAEMDGSGAVRVQMPVPGDTLNLADGTRRIVNPGGVGQPRDGDPRAAYALWDDTTGHFTFRRVSYPVEVTQQKMLDARLPVQLATRLSYGL